jgi:hypothetical protein
MIKLRFVSAILGDLPFEEVVAFTSVYKKRNRELKPSRISGHVFATWPRMWRTNCSSTNHMDTR